MRSLCISLLLLATAIPCRAQPTPDASRVYELSEVEVLPRPQNVQEFTTALQDGYPAHLRASRIEGAVQVAFVVGPDGVPRSARVAQSTDARFDSVTVVAVGRLRFTPALVSGRPVSVRVVQPVRWRLPPPEPAASSSDGDFHGVGASRNAVSGNPVDGYPLSEVEDPPQPINGQQFAQMLAYSYPPALRASGVSGTVQVRFRVELDGTTTNHSITHSSNPGFNAATVSAVQALRFRPGRLHGQPVRVWVEQPIQWTIAPENVTREPSAPPPGPAGKGAVSSPQRRGSSRP